MNRLNCPRCTVAYPRWRVPFGPGVFNCPSCGARLTFSRASARRIGFVGGLVLFGAALLGGLVLGFDRIWTWWFMVPFLGLAVILGHLVKIFVGVLELPTDHDGQRGRL